MILSRHFVFIHVPRTGGNFVLRVLLEHAPPDWQIQRLADHATVADIPSSHAHLPRLAFVRNPYDWYVSWFHFQQRTRSPFFEEISLGGSLPFAATMRRALQSNAALERGLGPFTQTLLDMLGDGMCHVRFGKTETLRADLLRLLAELAPPQPSLHEAIASLEPLNASQHDHFSRYYDAELREEIWRRDRFLFDSFGYQWEQT